MPRALAHLLTLTLTPAVVHSARCLVVPAAGARAHAARDARVQPGIGGVDMPGTRGAGGGAPKTCSPVCEQTHRSHSGYSDDATELAASSRPCSRRHREMAGRQRIATQTTFTEGPGARCLRGRG